MAASFSVLFSAPAAGQNYPQPPAVSVDTTMPVQTGSVIWVPAGGDLQAALNAARLGDTIELQAGATWTGSFGLPTKTSGTGWIVVRSSAWAQLPPPGTRVGPADAVNMARVVAHSYQMGLWTSGAAHHYRFIGIEVTGDSLPAAGIGNGGLIQLDGGVSPNVNVAMTSLSQVPHHLVFDRCYVHAPGNAGDYIRGFVFNSAYTALIDSYVSGFKSTQNDTQTVNGWNGPGPFKLVNNYLEAAGENVMFGGARATIPGLVPSDIEIRLNTFQKLLSWRREDPSYAGTAWLVMNLMEVKNAQRVLIEGNLFQDHWAVNQSGFFLMLSPRNEVYDYWNVASDITFRYNRIRRVTAGIAVSGHDTLYPQWVPSARLAIHDNVFEGLGFYVVPGTSTGVVLAVNNGMADITFEHNTIFNTYNILMFDGPSQGVDTNFVYRNNILHGAHYGIVGYGTGDGVLALNAYAPGWSAPGNVLVGPWPNEVGLWPTYPAGVWPPGSFFPNTYADVVFADLANGDYHLGAASPYKNAGSDRKDPGADIDALVAASAGVGNPPAPTSGPAATTTTISAPSTTYGSGATVTVTVGSSAGTPTGSVSLAVDGSSAVSASLSSGQAQFTVTGLSVGSHSLSATYASQGNFAASSAVGILQVNSGSSTSGSSSPTSLLISAPPVTFPSSALVTVTVNSNAGTPTGIVSLSVDGGAPLTASLSGGRAQFTLSNPSRGTHTVNATYPAQQNFGSSGDSGILQVN